MYKIGYVSFEKNWNEEYIELFTSLDYEIEKMTEDDLIALKQKEILFIERASAKNFQQVCLLLMEVAKLPNLLVYVVSLVESFDRESRLVFLKLGATGFKDCTISLEEFSYMIKNTLIKLPEYQSNQLQKQQIDQQKFRLNPDNLSVVLQGIEISLTRIEYHTLELLYKNAYKAVSYQEISYHIWKNKYEHSNYRVTNIIFSLRKKLEKKNTTNHLIKTVRSKGYMLDI